MKRLIQESDEESMVTLGSSSRVSTNKTKVESICGINSKTSGSAGSLLEDSSLPPCSDSKDLANGGDKDGGLAQLCNFGQQASHQLPRDSSVYPSVVGSQDPASITTSCQQTSERNPTKLSLSRDDNQRCSHVQQEPFGSVVDYIVRELRGISHLQSEIAELRQHLTQVRGSVDEVSNCVDSVLSEIEGLQVGSCSLAKIYVEEKPPEPQVDGSSEEAILYLYGLPEQAGENTVALVHSFLAKHLCINGMQCNRYIREAYRADQATAPRPTVVKLTHLEHRDFILQKSALLQSVGVWIATRDEPNWPQSDKNPQMKSSSFLQQQLQYHNVKSSNLDKPFLQLKTGDSELMTEAYKKRDHNEHREAQTPEQSVICFPPKNNLAKQSDMSKPVDKIKGTLGTSQVITGNYGELIGEETSPSIHCQSEEPSLVPISKEEDCGKSPVFKQCSQGPEAYKITEKENNCSDTSEADSCLSLSGLLKTENKILACEAGLGILSSKQLEDLLTNKPRGFATLNCDTVIEEIIIRPENFTDMVHIDLNEEEYAAHVLKDVFEKSPCGLGGSQEEEDVEIKYHTNKLGRAIYHFRSALQGVFQKLENNGSISPEDLESNESGSQSENSDRFLGTINSGSAHDFSVESPGSQGSENLLSVISGGVVFSTQEDQNFQDHNNFSLATSSNSPLQCSLPNFAPCLGSEICSRPESPKQGQISLEQVCAETIYLNKCINNFKNVLKEKRLRQKKLLHELVQKANHLSIEDIDSGISHLCFLRSQMVGCPLVSQHVTKQW